MAAISLVKTVSLAAFILALAVASHPVQAQVAKPFKIQGQGVAPLGLPLPNQAARPHGIVGQATHLGRHTGQGTLKTTSVNPNSDGTLTGNFESELPFKFVAANGDVLVCRYGDNSQGTYTLTPVNATGLFTARFVARFVPVSEQCTGRFRGVTGSWIMVANTQPIQLSASGFADPIRYDWQGEGALIFDK